MGLVDEKERIQTAKGNVSMALVDWVVGVSEKMGVHEEYVV